MKRNLLYLMLILAITFVSCNNGGDDAPELYTDYSCIIVNQGNLKEKNASISYYRESDNTIKNGAFKKANGRNLAAITESVAVYDSIALIMCNTPDKIEIIDVRTAKVICAPIEGNNIITPRYAAINSKYAYVTCWGNPVQDGWWDVDHVYPIWIYPNSYVLKIDLKTKQVVKKINCGGEAEGIILNGDKLFVGVNNGVDVFNTTDDSKITTIKHNTLYGGAKQFAIDKYGKLWYSVSSSFMGAGYVVVNATSNAIEQEIPTSLASDQLCMNKAKDKVLFYNSISDEDWLPVSASVYTLDITSRQVNTTPIFTGEQFYGIGANPKTGVLYTAEIYNYTANSAVKTFSEQGTLLKQAESGVTACRFVFL